MSIHHFWSQFEPHDAATKQRQEVAHATWAVQPWKEFPIPDAILPRQWEEEGRTFPYVCDLFNIACSERTNTDIMVYTNSDICVRSDCASRIAAAMQDTEAFYSMRRDFSEPFHEPVPDDVIARGSAYVGSDLYAFRVGWWERNRMDFPDMIVAFELWDAVLRQLIIETNANAMVSVPDLSYHCRHSSWWESPANRYRLKGQIHNLRLGCHWLRQHGIDPKTHGVPRKAGGFSL